MVTSQSLLRPKVSSEAVLSFMLKHHMRDIMPLYQRQTVKVMQDPDKI